MKEVAPELMELIACLGRVARAEQKAWAVEKGRLHPVHLEALDYLARANRYSDTPQALAEYLGSTKGTISQSLLLLYRRGLITRETDAKDRRVVRLALSAKGRRVLAASRFGPEWAEALKGVAGQDLEAAVRVLSGILGTLQRSRGGRSFGVCHTCALFQVEGRGGFRCGLTGEALSAEDSQLICRVHAPRV